MQTKVQDTDTTGVVFDIQRMSIHDGPGIRTTVFLKGCPLRCLWCHNPEGHEARPQLAFNPALCIGCGYCLEHCSRGVHAWHRDEHRMERERCIECFSCAVECHSQALTVVGRRRSARDVLEEVERDRPFYEQSGGGMTLSGGEPFAQFEFALSLLRGARERHIHACVETCGFVPRGHLESVVGLVDLFLFDCKETDPDRHVAFTGRPLAPILDNLRALDARGAPIVLRCPIIPEFNLRRDHLEGIAAMARSLRHCMGVEVMGYHGMGVSKHARLGTNALGPETAMTQAAVAAVVEQLRLLDVENVTSG